MKQSSPIMNNEGGATWAPLLVIAVVTPPLNGDDVLQVEGDSSQLLAVDRPAVHKRLLLRGGAGWHKCVALASRTGQVSIKAFFPLSNPPRDGDSLLTDLEAVGIDCSHVRRWAGPTKRNVVVECLGDGHRIIFRDPARASAPVQVYDIEGLATADVILVAGSVDAEVVEAVRDRAGALGIPWYWNPAASHFGFVNDLARKSTTLRLIQLNDQETAQYSGLPAGTPAAALLASVSDLATGRAFILTCGSGGSFGIDRHGQEGPIFCPAPGLPPGTPIVGLGDKHFALVAYAFHRTRNL